MRITTKAEALKASGSRYAPVSAITATAAVARGAAFIGKPCEAAALRGLRESSGHQSSGELVLSFFCAGVPSQHETDSLTHQLAAGAQIQPVEVRYRGRGWPGDFRVTGQGGRSATMTYEESWGHHLGRNLQFRCKVCVDGVGEFADVAVGDYWHSGEGGYPSFVDAPGRSVVIARTAMGLEALLAAQSDGVITLEPIDLADVVASQPLQQERRMSLLGRILGRQLTGRRTPVYRGFGLWGLAARKPVLNGRAVVGTWLRSRRGASDD